MADLLGNHPVIRRWRYQDMAGGTIEVTWDGQAVSPELLNELIARGLLHCTEVVERFEPTPEGYQVIRTRRRDAHIARLRAELAALENET